MSKVINLNQWRQQKVTEQKYSPISGFLIWLHCPSCKTTEYTELKIPGGRVHKCGTLVEEVEVPIDIRAEYTISQRNLKAIESKAKSRLNLKAKIIQAVETEYQQRLQLMVSGPIEPYPDDWEPETNGIETISEEPYGILITNARQANKHFPKK